MSTKARAELYWDTGILLLPGGSRHTSFGGSELYWNAWILLLDNLGMFGTELARSVGTLKSNLAGSGVPDRSPLEIPNKSGKLL